MSEWRVARLSDVCEIVGRGITPQYADDGPITVVNQKCIREGRLDLAVSRRHGGRAVTAPKLIQEGDVLVNSTGVGTLGRTAAVQTLVGPTTVDTHVTIARPSTADPGWVRYLFRLLEPSIEALAEGSTGQTELSRHRLAELEVLVPSLSEQRAIAGVLGALDDKIESNRRMVEVGSALSKAELLGAPSSRSVQLGEVANVTKGLSYKGAGLTDAGVPMVNMGNAANFGWLKREGFKYYTGAFKPKHLARPGDVLVVNTEQTWRNEIIGWPLLVPSDVGDVLFTHHVFKAEFTPGFEALRLPYWASLFALRTRAMLDSMVYGTTVATLPAEALTRVEIRVPDSEMVIDFASNLLERVWEAERETIELESLRDILVRELLSGRLRVRDAEKVAQGAL